jgi:plasmid stabilization system protein ParE
MHYRLVSAAQRDAAHAAEWYAEQGGPHLATRFVDELTRVLELLTHEPGMGRPLTAGRRTFGLRVFPYSVIFRVVEDEIRVLVVRHQHRHPDVGMERR